MIVPRQKINVFISSICGIKRYDTLRANLKQLIEETNLANVYLFEETGASTLTAQHHYVWELENSDICIFIIDNLDGISPGVQKEIDTAKKYNIKSFFYFCDEKSKVPTPIQKGFNGSNAPKYKVVHSFEDLLEGAQSLIDDITSIYKYYCDGRLESKETSETQFSLTEESCNPSLIIDNTIIENTDRCKLYFHKMFSKFEKNVEDTSPLDDWCAQFLPILFEHISIKTFNTSMFLDELHKYLSNEHFAAVQKRWEAIQYYFNDNLQECVDSLYKALQIAKNNNLSEWFIKDILIDLRNKKIELFEAKNKYYYNGSEQQELTNSNRALYYPLIDRIQGSLYENFANDSFKTRLKSPNTISLGYNITQTDIISNCYVIAMFNGSLTHLLKLHEHIKTLAFWMSNKFSNWEFKMILLKEIIYNGSKKEIDSLHRVFPEILVKINHSDAMTLYDYCSNHPIKHKRMISQLKALCIVGYYLNDYSFSKITNELVEKINIWLKDKSPVLLIGDYIFNCLNEISYRMDPDILVNICCKFIDKGFSRFYIDMFKMLASKINISKLSKKSANELISSMEIILNKGDVSFQNLENVLISFRKQDAKLTQHLDKLISEKMPMFYENSYKLETSNEFNNYLHFIKKNIEEINKQNQEQGINGFFTNYSNSPHNTIRNILLIKNIELDPTIIYDALEASCETLLSDNQTITTKCNAMDLIIYLIQFYPNLVKHNTKSIESVHKNFDKVLNCNTPILDSNVSNISLKFSYIFLLGSFDQSLFLRLLEVIPYAQNQTSDQIRICNTIHNYLECKKGLSLEPQLESILLHTTLTWIDSDCIDIRWLCVKILFLLGRNKKLQDIISYQIINLIDNDNAYIKNLIQRNINESNMDSNTKKHVFSKCAIDNNYIVRKTYQELTQNQ